MEATSRISRLIRRAPQLLLPPVIYLLRDRLRPQVAPPPATAVGGLDQYNAIRLLGGLGVASLIGDEGLDGLLLDFCQKLTSDAGAIRSGSALGSQDGPLGSVVRDGYCHLEGHLGRNRMEQLGQSIQADFADRTSALWKCESAHDTHGGIFRFYGLDKVYPAVREVAADKQLTTLASAYLNTPVSRFDDLYLDIKTEKFGDDNNVIPHMDTCFKTLKVFMPLRDIGEEDAPFIFYPKTHLLHEWRLLKDFLVYAQYNSSYSANWSIFTFSEIARMASSFPEFSAKPVTVLGRAGDAIVADVRGVHAGSYLRRGPRFQFVARAGLLASNSNDPLKQSVRNRRAS